ncbi:CHAT domain-containing protein [Dactylosporangium sp. CA-152071]|uniref:CHAT domain-containing protein n=1 Tax=Dactylosporangium sp. CA-152071 TaxID=3239933 RepID=UPI003D948087
MRLAAVPAARGRGGPAVVVERAAALHDRGQRVTADMRPVQGSKLLREGLRLLDRLPAADQAGAATVRARLLATLGYAEVDQGRIDAGLRLLDEAEALLPPDGRGAVYGQRGVVLSRLGRDEEALRQFDAAVAALRSVGEPEALARALYNRGNVHMGLARMRAARNDFQRAVRVAERAGFDRIIPMARHSLGYLDHLNGNIPAALAVYREVAPRYQLSKPGMLPILALDRARALTAAGLFRDAEQELVWAVAQFRRRRTGQDYAEAQLARAEAALLRGDPTAARDLATVARAAFLRRDNHRWAALSLLLVLRAEQAAGRPALTDRATALASTLDDLGLREDATVARLVAARSSGTLPPRPPRSSRLDTRLLWHLTRSELLDATAAARHREAGLRELQRHRARFGCLDLQTGASAHGRDLAAAGLAAAVRDGTPRDIYRWSELARAQAMLLPPVRPPTDPAAAAALEELRQVRAVLRQAELDGSVRPATRDRPGRTLSDLRHRETALLRTIREQSWTVSGPGTATRPASFTAVRAALGTTAMVTYLRDGPRLLALTIVDGHATVVPLGSYAAAAESLLRLRADLDAAAGRSLPPRMAAALATATAGDATTLAGILLTPVLDRIADRALVVVPTGALVTVPWGMLPGCTGRPVTVTLSATTWLAARSRLPLPATSGLGTDRAAAARHAIAALHHAATMPAGSPTPHATAALSDSSAAHVAAALSDSSAAHVAAALSDSSPASAAAVLAVSAVTSAAMPGNDRISAESHAIAALDRTATALTGSALSAGPGNDPASGAPHATAALDPAAAVLTGSAAASPAAALTGSAAASPAAAMTGSATAHATAALIGVAVTSATVLLAGPGNDRAEAEIHAIAALDRAATVLTGAAATPAAALSAMDGAGIAHIAAHGHHEPDNPLFSALDLAGGPLMGYDLQRLTKPPTMVVLSACDLGQSEVRPGDETLGMAAALLATGTATVIASTSRVGDDTAMATMTAFHRHIHAGADAATALAAATRDHPGPFVCLGAA